MLLAIDVGNTNISVGAFEIPEIHHSWCLNSDHSKTADEYALLFAYLLNSAGIPHIDVAAAIIGSVVPPMTRAVASAVRLAFQIEPEIAKADRIPGILARVERPGEVGIDRLANCVAAHERYGSPAIIVDFGTTTTFDVTSATGDYVGGVIAPGVSMSIESLGQGAAQLPRIELRRPDKIVGTNTIACMESGTYWGYVYLVREMIKSIVEEIPHAPHVVATGGLATLLADEITSINHVDPVLTLHGLAIMHTRLQEDIP